MANGGLTANDIEDLKLARSYKETKAAVDAAQDAVEKHKRCHEEVSQIKVKVEQLERLVVETEREICTSKEHQNAKERELEALNQEQERSKQQVETALSNLKKYMDVQSLIAAAAISTRPSS